MRAIVLDAGGVSRLAVGTRAARERLRWAMHWSDEPPLVPSVVLTEALQGDHRRDFAANRLLSTCVVVPVDEATARRAARLRSLAGRGSAVDAVVVAMAEDVGGVVLTRDAPDLRALAAHAAAGVRIERV